MNKIQQLIQQYCPDGVEFKALGEVCSIFDGTHQTPKYTNEGVKFVSVENIKDLYASKKCISNDDFENIYKNKPQINDVFMTRIGTIGACAIVDKDEELAFYVTLTLIRPNQDIVNSKFVKYYIESSNGQKELRKRTLVNAVPIKINLGEIGKIQIPIPPLPIQQEIVAILDTFTALDVSLQAELEARRKQYEHYRNQLLNFEGKEVEWKMLGEVCKFVRGPFGGAIKKDCFIASGYAVYEQQHAIYGNTDIRYYISEEKYKELRRFEVMPGDLIMSCSGTMGKIAIIPDNAPKGVINQALLKLTVKKEIGTKYLKYYFENTITQQMNDEAKGGAIKNVASVDVLKKIKLPIPPLSEQERIVGILDKFDALVNTELPAEIAARRKQYEYYREKLLDFKTLQT